MPGQEREQPELGGGQRQERPTPGGLAGVLVDDQIGDLHHRLPQVSRTPQYRTDPGQQFCHHERLHQVVVGSRIEAVQAICDVVAGGEEDNGALRGGPQAMREPEPVHPGHHDVEDRQLGTEPAGDLVEVGAVRPGMHPVSRTAQPVLQRRPEGVVVLDDEHPHRIRSQIRPLRGTLTRCLGGEACPCHELEPAPGF